MYLGGQGSLLGKGGLDLGFEKRRIRIERQV